MLEDTSDRKIAVIFATDVVGYSKSIEQNENQTLINLKECRNILDKLITKNKGRIFNTGGDSVLAEFNSAVTAVECASKFQKQIRERNADLGEDKKMEFRIGIHIGDVVIDGDNLYGEGVNIAARLESFSQPNGLSISNSIYDLVKGRTDNKFNDLGIQKIKNNSVHVLDLIHQGILIKRKLKGNNNLFIFGSMTAFFIIGVLTYIIILFNNNDPNSDNMTYNTRMLILPFEVRAPNNSYDYLSQGTLEYLVSNLTGVKDFEILSSSLSNSIAKKNYSDSEILKNHGVNYILRGSLQIMNEDVRISVNLTDVSKDKQIWTQTKTPKINEIFITQDKLALDMLGLLGLGIRDSSKSSIFSNIERPKELQLILKWLEIQRGFDKDVWHQMVDVSNQLYEINPNGIVHNIIKSWDYHWKITWGVSTDVKSDFEKGIEFADRAIELQKETGHEVPDSYLAKSFLYMRQGKTEETLKYANLSRKYITNQPESWSALGVIYHFNGKNKEAIEALEIYKSQILVPADLFMEILGWAYTFENNYEKANETFQYIEKKEKHYQKTMKSKVYLALSYLSYLQGEHKKSNEYFNLHDSMENKQDLASLSRGGSGRSRIMEKPIKFWKEMGLK